MKEILNTHLSNVIDEDELVIRPKEIAWNLFIDVLIMEEFSVGQLQPISVGIKAALEDLKFPAVIATFNQNTKEVEVDLKETFTDHFEDFKTINTNKVPILYDIGIFEDKIIFDLT